MKDYITLNGKINKTKAGISITIFVNKGLLEKVL